MSVPPTALATRDIIKVVNASNLKRYLTVLLHERQIASGVCNPWKFHDALRLIALLAEAGPTCLTSLSQAQKSLSSTV